MVSSELTTHWERRFARLQRRLRIRFGDLRNDVRWHIGGGRTHYRRHWRESASLHRWVFIVGCNNSGTSLLQRLLEWTGEVSTFPAEGQLYTRAIARDHNPAHRRVWTEYLEELRLGGSDPLARAPRLVHDWLTNLPRPIRPVVVEKTPANTARIEWLRKVFPRACFIGLVRNGYAVSEGIRRKAGQPLATGARHWNAVNRMLVDAAEGLGDSYLEVRYEDLAERPVATMHAVCRLAGIESLRLDGLAGGDDRAASEAMATVFGPIRNRDPETLARLSAGDIAAIRANARPMLDHFGYELGARRAAG